MTIDQQSTAPAQEQEYPEPITCAICDQVFMTVRQGDRIVAEDEDAWVTHNARHADEINAKINAAVRVEVLRSGVTMEAAKGEFRLRGEVHLDLTLTEARALLNKLIWYFDITPVEWDHVEKWDW